MSQTSMLLGGGFDFLPFLLLSLSLLYFESMSSLLLSLCRRERLELFSSLGLNLRSAWELSPKTINVGELCFQNALP